MAQALKCLMPMLLDIGDTNAENPHDTNDTDTDHANDTDDRNDASDANNIKNLEEMVITVLRKKAEMDPELSTGFKNCRVPRTRNCLTMRLSNFFFFHCQLQKHVV
jgi:hypothetical protein